MPRKKHLVNQPIRQPGQPQEIAAHPTNLERATYPDRWLILLVLLWTNPPPLPSVMHHHKMILVLLDCLCGFPPLTALCITVCQVMNGWGGMQGTKRQSYTRSSGSGRKPSRNQQQPATFHWWWWKFAWIYAWEVRWNFGKGEAPKFNPWWEKFIWKTKIYFQEYRWLNFW